LIDYKTYIEWS